MVYKNIDLKIHRFKYKKLIFSLIMILYSIGLCIGCTFAFKNAENLDFIHKVTLIENLVKVEETAFLARCVKLFTRDLIFIFLIFVFKYSGVLKGCCLCAPVVMAVQNACIYSTIILTKKISFFSLVFHYLLKDTAVSFLIMLYLYIIVLEIIGEKSNPKNDIKKIIVYISGLTFIYFIDIALKFMIYPFH